MAAVQVTDADEMRLKLVACAKPLRECTKMLQTLGEELEPANTTLWIGQALRNVDVAQLETVHEALTEPEGKAFLADISSSKIASSKLASQYMGLLGNYLDALFRGNQTPRRS
ncbi:hypothetical protein [Hydrogenophaga sp. BPS33]|uniref:hypothetical protein n=1 Tax=Hydrogenophaga sp. BPS33 TaxID=2651974 RepID=UPI00131FF0AC|nr:hypothetical protein [Hydrogenophaga sp. BPS33]QHE86923.1 hypothetical protein F9K07_19465 [Hydrogenophaga sp. BPS33]